MGRLARDYSGINTTISNQQAIFPTSFHLHSLSNQTALIPLFFFWKNERWAGWSSRLRRGGQPAAPPCRSKISPFWKFFTYSNILFSPLFKSELIFFRRFLKRVDLRIKSSKKLPLLSRKFTTASVLCRMALGFTWFLLAYNDSGSDLIYGCSRVWFFRK